MRSPLNDTTNSTAKSQKGKKCIINKASTITYLQDAYDTADCIDFKYNLKKCMQILNNVDLEEIADMRQALEEQMLQNEIISEENNVLLLRNKELEEIINKSVK